MKKQIHLSSSIDGLLKHPVGQLKWFTDDNGNPMSDHAVRAELGRLKSLGHKLIGNADCEGFDPFGGGCPSHVIDED